MDTSEVLTCLAPHLSTADLVQLRSAFPLARSQIPEPVLVVRVTTLSGHGILQIHCSPLHTLDHLMGEIERVTNVPKCLQRILRGGRQYWASDFTRTLEELGSPTYLHLVQRMLCSGCPGH